MFLSISAFSRSVQRPLWCLLIGFGLWPLISHSPKHPTQQAKLSTIASSDSNRLYLPDDLEATLWAESPMLYNPTNMDVDARGRLWVTEAVEYREFNNKADKRLNFKGKGDRVVILEDTDADGKADKSKVFIQDTLLTAPLGIAVIGNKVVVSCAPNLLVYTDENGDDVPDKREVLLTGFGGFDHDHSLHSLVAGPDGLWYFNVGNAGPHIVTDRGGQTLRAGSIYTGGTPYNSKNEGNQVSADGRVWVGGLALRMTPSGKNLTVLAHNFRNSYEVAVDSYGNMWQNDNDDQVIACRTSFVMENGNAGYFSADGTRMWNADRRPGQEMFASHWHQDDPGVMPAGDNTGAGSPTGIVVYEGDALGEQYRGLLLSCEAGRNVLFGYKPQKNGAGFRLNRTDFVSSQGPQSSERYEWFETGADKRKWFRPSDVCVGTDGSLYIADWYDPIVGGHAMHDKKGYGRIYRITPKNGKVLTPPTINLSTIRGQIKALRNPAVNVRNLGFEALVAEGSKAIADVKEELTDEQNPFVKARLVWVLAQLGNEGLQETEHLLQSPEADLRLVAFRALRRVRGDMLPYANRLATDPDPAVRREVAIALRDIPLSQCENALVSLVNAYDGQDPWYLEALGTALDGPKSAQFYGTLRSLYPENPDSWSSKTEHLIWRIHPVQAVADLRTRASLATVSETSRKKALAALAFVKDKTAAEAMLSLVKSPLPDVAAQARWWLNFRKGNDWADLLNWAQVANQTLTPSYRKMLELKKKVTDKNLTVKERIAAAKLMAKDPDGGQMIVDLKSQWQLPDTIAKRISEDIFTNPDAGVRSLASQFFTRNGQPLKIDFIVRMKGDLAKGKTTFETNCANCHRHGELGAEIGPDLTNIHKKFDKNGLLDAIVNPSASLVFGFEGWTITTKKGESHFGFLLGDGKTVVLKDLAGKQTVVKAEDIKTRQKMPNSLMPDPVSMGLKEQDLADLVDYLLGFQ
jgi:putative membrane-bound dehydrogenase-like protein